MGLEGEDLGDFSNPLGGTFPEQESHTNSDKLWVSQESEENTSLLVGMYASNRHDALYDCRLSHIADVYCSLESRVDCS